jgi:peptidoglycan/LPS O-acetylase OafA/YrhL
MSMPVLGKEQPSNVGNGVSEAPTGGSGFVSDAPAEANQSAAVISPPVSHGVSSGRYISLDLLRGFACVGVIVAHAAGRQPDAGSVLQELIARLWWGLPAFYVISGYSITASIERLRRKGTPFREYFLRRLIRIFPPYWATVAIVAAVGWLVRRTDVLSHEYDGFAPIPSPSELSLWQWLGTLTLTEGWRDHVLTFDGGRWFLAHAWTLGYEEQFYVLAGLLVLFAAGRWFAVVAVLSAAVAVLAIVVPHDSMTGFWFNGRWIVFACGIGVYYQVHKCAGRARLVVPIGLAIAFAASALAGPGFSVDGVISEIGIGAFTAGLLIVAYPYDGVISRLSILRPFNWCGVRCYSLYLLHWPIAKAMFWTMWMLGIRNPYAFLLTSVPLSIMLSLCAAAVFFHVVERPCMSPQSSPAGTRRPLQTAAAPIRPSIA